MKHKFKYSVRFDDKVTRVKEICKLKLYSEESKKNMSMKEMLVEIYKDDVGEN